MLNLYVCVYLRGRKQVGEAFEFLFLSVETSKNQYPAACIKMMPYASVSGPSPLPSSTSSSACSKTYLPITCTILPGTRLEFQKLTLLSAWMLSEHDVYSAYTSQVNLTRCVRTGVLILLDVIYFSPQFPSSFPQPPHFCLCIIISLRKITWFSVDSTIVIRRITYIFPQFILFVVLTFQVHFFVRSSSSFDNYDYSFHVISMNFLHHSHQACIYYIYWYMGRIGESAHGLLCDVGIQIVDRVYVILIEILLK